ncbi:MAG TPA: hypothetical protein EYH31_01335 [Anaerolineae bacterium]|nr:hypothetical protein [Anaerolineae bacterium]
MESQKQNKSGGANTDTPLPEGYRMTELGPLPEEWRVVRLGEVGEVITGRTPSTARQEYWDNGSIPSITPPDLDGRPIQCASRTITKEGLKECRPLPRGAVLVSGLLQSFKRHWQNRQFRV